MELATSSQEVLLCVTCGDQGFTNAFVYCIKCLGACIHRYCLDVLPRTLDEFVPWLCENCEQTQPLKPSVSQKETTRVETIRRKKKQKKKKKIASLVAVKDKSVSPTKSLLKEASVSSSECNKTTPCVDSCLQKGVIEKQVSESSESVHKRSPLKESAKRKRNESPSVEKTKEHKSKKTEDSVDKITPCVDSCLQKGVIEKQVSESSQSVHKRSPVKESTKRKRNESPSVEKTKEHKSQKMEDSVDNSCCGSSCADLTLKNKEGLTPSVEDPKCEIQQSEISHDQLGSDSSSMEKKSDKNTEDYDCQAETANQMHDDEDMRARKACTDDSQPAEEFKNHVQYINYQPARPVLDPVWRGSFNIAHTDYDLFEGFVGHLSSKACSKALEESTMLPSLLCLEMHSKAALWPKSFVQSPPSDGNIALYFFPGDAKVERDFEHLVMDMVDEGLAMRAIAKNAELLIFTSAVLPLPYWRFQGKYYLWGVFRGKREVSLPPSNHKHAVLANINNHEIPKDSSNEVTSGQEILTRVTSFGSQSPQTSLCDYGYSELNAVQFVAEQDNDVLMKNHQFHPTESLALPETNSTTKYDPKSNTYGGGLVRGRGFGHSRGRGYNYNYSHNHDYNYNNNYNLGKNHFKGRGRGRGHGSNNVPCNKKFQSQERPNNYKTKDGTFRDPKDLCYRCGMTGHWSRTCRTAPHLCKLYQESLEGKEKEVNFTDITDETVPEMNTSNLFDDKC